MVAEEMSMGEQAKLELLFQSISLEKLEQLSSKLTNFQLKFNKPKVNRLCVLILRLLGSRAKHNSHQQERSRCADYTRNAKMLENLIFL